MMAANGITKLIRTIKEPTIACMAELCQMTIQVPVILCAMNKAWLGGNQPNTHTATKIGLSRRLVNMLRCLTEWHIAKYLSNDIATRLYVDVMNIPYWNHPVHHSLQYSELRKLSGNMYSGDSVSWRSRNTNDPRKSTIDWWMISLLVHELNTLRYRSITRQTTALPTSPNPPMII